MTQTARVIARFGADMLIDDGNACPLRINAKRKLDRLVCGDWVQWEHNERGDCIITEQLPRRNELARPDHRGQPRIMGANIDRVVIVTATLPSPDLQMIDHYLVAAESMQAEVLILLNKVDLPGSEDWETQLNSVYGPLGYEVLAISTENGTGLDDLRTALSSGTSILTGQSGVGKSSLVNVLVPDAELRTGALSGASGEGKHTTTQARLFALSSGGALMDSPGVREFGLLPLSSEQRQQGFREIRQTANQCRFHNCQHHQEPGCAVKAAVARGDIAATRYKHYLNLLTGNAL